MILKRGRRNGHRSGCRIAPLKERDALLEPILLSIGESLPPPVVSKLRGGYNMDVVPSPYDTAEASPRGAQIVVYASGTYTASGTFTASGSTPYGPAAAQLRHSMALHVHVNTVHSHA